MPAPDPDRARLVVLARHGTTAWSGTGRFTGGTDVALDARGDAQARALADRLAALGPQRLVSSDLARAAATAGRIAERTGLPVHRDARLREERLGGWEGRTRDEVAAAFPDEFARWDAGRLDPGPQREGLPAVVARAAPALHAATSGVDTVVVVTHVNVVIGLAQRLLGLPTDGTVVLDGPEPGGALPLRRTAAGWTVGW